MTSRINIILRLLYVFLTGFGAAFLIFETSFWLLGIWVIFFCIVGIISLIRHIELSKKELYNFLEAIKQDDFSQSAAAGKHYNKLNFNLLYRDISQIFHRLNSERASEHLLLQTVVEHINVAIVVFDEQGILEISNKATRELFQLPHFRKINKLFSHHPQLENLVLDKAMERMTYKMTIQGNLTTLAIKKSYFKIKARSFTIVSFQDIRNELEEKELESWQKLIRVLTHEIMNTAIPVATLAGVISQMMIDENNQIHEQLSESSKTDIYKGLKTIENRSKGLTKFVESYKQLTQLKPIKLKETNLNVLITDAMALLEHNIKGSSITIIYNQKDIYFRGDKELFSQVIINLLLNAMEALDDTDKGVIKILTSDTENELKLSIHDSGIGIDHETLEQIFIPFFTTKEEGSGIGLSLCRQIVRMHHGKITVKSVPGEGTCVEITI